MDRLQDGAVMLKLSKYLQGNAENRVWVLLLIGAASIILFTIVMQAISGIQVSNWLKQTEQNSHTATQEAAITQIKNGKQYPIFGVQLQTAHRVNTDLTLHGVIKAPDPRLGKAIIAGKDKESDIYSVGDDIKDGIKLYRVYEDRVLIKGYRGIETLYLAWDKLTSSSSPINNNDSDNEDATREQPVKRGQVSEEMQERLKKIRERYQERFKNLDFEGGDRPSPEFLKGRGWRDGLRGRGF